MRLNFKKNGGVAATIAQAEKMDPIKVHWQCSGGSGGYYNELIFEKDTSGWIVTSRHPEIEKNMPKTSFSSFQEVVFKGLAIHFKWVINRSQEELLRYDDGSHYSLQDLDGLTTEQLQEHLIYVEDNRLATVKWLEDNSLEYLIENPNGGLYISK